MAKNGTAYERVTRQMVIDIKEDIGEIKENISKLANHYSKRIPPLVTLIITLLSSLSVGLIVRAFS